MPFYSLRNWGEVMEKDESVPGFRREIVITVLTGLLALVGGAAGGFISASTNRSQWERETAYQEDRILLDKRVDVAERMVRIINKGPRANMLRDRVSMNAEISRLQVERGSQGSSDGADLVRDVDEALKEYHDLNAEFGAVATLAAMFFGPETKTAIKAINVNSEWWRATPEQNQALMDAVEKEMLLGLPRQRK